jgi:hypothetical protein
MEAGGVMRDGYQFVLIFFGVALLFYGGLPVWHALLVWNGMMHVGSIEVHQMDGWDQWAFAPRFVISAAIGAMLLLVGAFGLVQSKWNWLLEDVLDWLMKERD